jgi:hypothetical protein
MDIPTLPRWATTAGKTLEPAESKKDSGWNVNERPPARWWNWLLNQNYEYARRTLRLMMNPQPGAVLLATAPYDLIWSPVHGGWISIDASKINFLSVSGGYSRGLPNLPITPIKKTACVHAGALLVGSVSGIMCSTGPTAWTVQSTPNSVQHLATGFGYTNRVVTGASSMGGLSIDTAPTYTGPFTPSPAPPVAPVPGIYIGALIHLAGNDYGCLLDNGDFFISYNDGATWSLAGTLLDNYAVPGKFGAIDFDADAQRLIAVGVGVSGNHSVQYSDDLGATWTMAAYPNLGAPTAGAEAVAVRYLGEGVWIAGGAFSLATAETIVPFVASFDHGLTWTVLPVYGPSVGINHFEFLNASPTGWRATQTVNAHTMRSLEI